MLGNEWSLVAMLRNRPVLVHVKICQQESLHVNSTLGIRVRVDQICRDYELEILVILLTVDLGVMDMSEFDVILRMDWLATH